jgi:hypothetical protein
MLRFPNVFCRPDVLIGRAHGFWDKFYPGESADKEDARKAVAAMKRSLEDIRRAL